MVTRWLLIDTIAMIGSPALREAVASVARAGRASFVAALADPAAVSAVSASVTASVTVAGGPDCRIASPNCAVVNRFVMPCLWLCARKTSTQKTFGKVGGSCYATPHSLFHEDAGMTRRGACANLVVNYPFNIQRYERHQPKSDSRHTMAQTEAQSTTSMRSKGSRRWPGYGPCDLTRDMDRETEAPDVRVNCSSAACSPQ